MKGVKMARFETMDDLRTNAESKAIEVVTLQELRETLGYKKLGTRVLEELSLKLAGQGLGYFPKHILDSNPTPRASDTVRIYPKDSRVGKVIQSVLEPTDTGDTFLLELAEPDDAAADMLDAIRKVLGD